MEGKTKKKGRKLNTNMHFRFFVRIFLLFQVEVAFAEVFLSHCIIGGGKEITCILKKSEDTSVFIGDKIVFNNVNAKKVEYSYVTEVRGDYIFADFYTNYICKNCTFSVIKGK